MLGEDPGDGKDKGDKTPEEKKEKLQLLHPRISYQSLSVTDHRSAGDSTVQRVTSHLTVLGI